LHTIGLLLQDKNVPHDLGGFPLLEQERADLTVLQVLFDFDDFADLHVLFDLEDFADLHVLFDLEDFAVLHVLFVLEDFAVLQVLFVLVDFSVLHEPFLEPVFDLPLESQDFLLLLHERAVRLLWHERGLDLGRTGEVGLH
jgi:hypothetical protein